MKNLFVPYELALKLKEKGFNEPCFAVYVRHKLLMIGQPNDLQIYTTEDFEDDIKSEDIIAPLYQQVTDWFREEHNIHIHISRMYCYVGDKPRTFDGWCVYIDNGVEDSDLECNSIFIKMFYPTYYEALIKAIEEALKLI